MMSLASWLFTTRSADLATLALGYPRKGQFRAVNIQVGKTFEGRLGAVPGRFLLRIAAERGTGPPAGSPVARRPYRNAEIVEISLDNGKKTMKFGRNAASAGSWKAERRM